MKDRPKYVVVLAKNTHEGNVYAKRTGLRHGGYRVATSANSVKGVRVADAHVLPGFDARPDRHAIRAALRWQKGVVFVDAQMPPGPAPQGAEAIGEQLEIPDAEAALVGATPEALPTTEPADVITTVEESDGEEAGATEPSEDPAPPAPKRRRQRSQATADALPPEPDFVYDPDNPFGGPDARPDDLFGGPDAPRSA